MLLPKLRWRAAHRPLCQPKQAEGDQWTLGSCLGLMQCALFGRHFEQCYHQNWGDVFAFPEKSLGFIQLFYMLISFRLMYGCLDLKESRKLPQGLMGPFLTWFNIYNCVLMSTVRPFQGDTEYHLYSMLETVLNISVLCPDYIDPFLYLFHTQALSYLVSLSIWMY